MIVSYERVSTTKQQNGIEQQHNDIVRYCDFKQIELDRTFTDFGISGGTDDREQFQEMMKLVKQGLVDEIIITELSRWGRNLGDCIKNLDILKKKKVNLVCLKENINLESPSGTLMSNLLMCVMEWEKSITGERVKNILNDKKLNNKRYTKSVYGYDFVNGKMVENQRELLMLKKIKMLRGKGKSYNEIKDYLNRNGYKKKNNTEFNRDNVVKLCRKYL
jgi:site-specific DNA recombinase